MGLGRRLGKEVHQKMGLSPQQFRQIYDRLDLYDVNVITKWAAIMLGFRTLLRKANLVQEKLTDIGDIVLRSDIEYTPTGVILNRKTKTIQKREYVLRIPVSYINSSCFCAASMLITHLARTPHIKDGPLFLLYKDKQWKPLLYKDLLVFIKDCVKMINLNPSDVGLHSLRRSGASYLHELGFSLVDIMNAGDWRSLAALQYLISPFSRKAVIEKQAAISLQTV